MNKPIRTVKDLMQFLDEMKNIHVANFFVRGVDGGLLLSPPPDYADSEYDFTVWIQLKKWEESLSEGKKDT